MINGEKYRDKLLKFIEEKDAGSFTFSKGEEGKFWQCGGRSCSECGMSKERSNCSVARLKWLLSEYKEPIKVSKLEYGILEHILENTGYKYMARDESNNIYIYGSKPEKHTNYWNNSIGCSTLESLSSFDDLFKFVQWSDKEPTIIKDILENCVVNEVKEEQ